MDGRPNRSLTGEHGWHAPGDDDVIEKAAQAARTSHGVLLHGDAGAGQEQLAHLVAQQLADRGQQIELPGPPSLHLSQLLESRRSGLVFFLPDISILFEADVDAVVRLVVRHGGLVVAAATDRDSAASSSLNQRLDLTWIHVLPLTRASTARFLDSGLGGRMSECAAGAVFDDGGGNREMMRSAVEDWLESGALIRHDGIWVIREPNPPPGPRFTRCWDSRLAALDLDVRDVYEILALAGELPLSVLLRLCRPDAVDAVYEAGLLDLRGTAQRQARLHGAANASTVRTLVPPGRSRSLYDRAAASLDEKDLRHPGFAVWRMRCGLEVELAELVAAAEDLSTHSPAEAKDILASLTGRPQLTDQSARRLDEVRMKLLLSRSPIDVWRFVMRGRTAKTGQPDTVRAAELVHASWRGDVRPLLAAREGWRLPGDLDWMFRQAVHEALVMSGRVEEGIRADADLIDELESSKASSATSHAKLGHAWLHILAGEWLRAADVLATIWDTDGRSSGGLAAVSGALSHLLMGEHGECAHILSRELPQIRIFDHREILPLAQAMLALSLASTGDEDGARVALADVTSMPGGDMWRLAWASTFLAAQALGLLGKADDAARQLMRRADLDQDLDNRSQELLSLSAAVQMGHDAALERLESTAERTGGRFAQSCLAVARGLRMGDVDLVDEGAIMATAIGQNLFAEFAQRRVAQMNGSAEAAPRDYRSAIDSLTPRQREIIGYVIAGHSNSSIARAIGISVRTVESHLHLVYGRLGFASRAHMRSTLLARGADQGE